MAELVAALSARLESPIISVGDRIVDGVPAAVKDIAIALFGVHDKIALLVGVSVVVGIYAALCGVLTLRRTLASGAGAIAIFAIVGALASTFTRTGTTWVGSIPTILGAAVTLVALVAVRAAGVSSGRANAELHPSHRRRVLAMSGVFAIGGASLFQLSRNSSTQQAGTTSRTGFTLPSPDTALPPIPTTAQAPSADPFTTPNAEFYRIDTALTVPQVDVAAWSLRIHGLVDDERTFTMNELLDREVVESDITLTCVSNTVGGRFIGNARWLGVRLDDLLEEIGLDEAANQIVGRSVDGYTCGFPTSTLDGRDALVAVGMNGEPLPLEHGFPARLIVPGLYGYVSATKWLTEIELTTFDAFDHYWAPRGYAVEAPIKIQSRIDRPRGLDRIPAGSFVLGGVAWSQPAGIAAVELSIDNGPWQPVTLADEVSGSTWRQWSFDWLATPGRHSLTVRATNHEGLVQTSERAEPLPDGASGHHTVVVLVDEE